MTDPVIVYTSESIAHGISAISVWALLFAILRNPKVRSNTFNLYLVFCLTPDAVYFLLKLAYNLLRVVDEYWVLYVTGDYWQNERSGWVSYWFSEGGIFFWLCGSLGCRSPSSFKFTSCSRQTSRRSDTNPRRGNE